MKVWGKKLVPVAFAFSSVAFLIAGALKPLMKAQPMNVTFVGVGVLTFILAIATWRKSRDGAGPPAA